MGSDTRELEQRLDLVVLGGGNPERRGVAIDPVACVCHHASHATEARVLVTLSLVTWMAKVLTVSDSVATGSAEDRSGPAVAALLADAGYSVVEQACVPDGVAPVADALRSLTEGFAGLVVTTGGTGFAPRDLTPEATLQVIDRHAPALAEAMYRSSPKARLARGVAGTAGRCLVLNVPGSPTAAAESLNAVIDVVPHALSLLSGENPHPHAHAPDAE